MVFQIHYPLPDSPFKSIATYRDPFHLTFVRLDAHICFGNIKIPVAKKRNLPFADDVIPYFRWGIGESFGKKILPSGPDQKKKWGREWKWHKYASPQSHYNGTFGAKIIAPQVNGKICPPPHLKLHLSLAKEDNVSTVNYFRECW